MWNEERYNIYVSIYTIQGYVRVTVNGLYISKYFFSIILLRKI